MRVAVTGGAGFIGAHLCRELVRRGSSVAVLDDLSTGRRRNLEGLPVDLRVGSILDKAALAEVCEGADRVVHLAALVSVPQSLAEPMHCHEVNATGTLNVLETARRIGSHVVVASSSSVYGRGEVQPKREDMPVMPASPYAAAKVATESYVRAYQESFHLPALVFRFFNVFGPGQPADHAYAAVVPAFVSAALRGEALQIFGDGEQSRDFTYVGTVARALADATLQRMSHPDPVNLAWGSRTTLNELVAMLTEILGGRVTVQHGPPRPGDVRHSQAADLTLRQMLPHLRQMPLRQALEATVSWMRADTTRLPAQRPAQASIGAVFKQ